MVDYEEELMGKVAWYYYMQDMTQQGISELLGISRMRVVKLLDKARKSGVIQFKIRQESVSRIDVERALAAKYNLNDVFVVPVSASDDINDSIAKAASMYISDRLPDNGFINIGYGDTPGKLLNYLASSTDRTISCVSLTGGVNYYLPNTQSGIFRAKLYLIPAPLLASTKHLAECTRDEPAVQEIVRMVNLSNLTVVGIGSMSDEATIVKSNILTKNDFLYLRMQGAVGDILSHFIDANGQLVDAAFDERMISTPLETLKELKNVIGVAGGKDKIESIRAVLNGQYLDVLITDEITAAALLEDPVI